MRRRLIIGVGAFVGMALAVGVAQRAARKPLSAPPPVAQPAVAEAPPAPPEQPTRPVAVAPAERAGMPPRFEAPLEGDARGSLTPPVIHVEIGDASERGPAPGPEPLVPPVVDLGTIEFGRGARPTAEPLVPPVIVVSAEELERPVPRR